jgi:hypothetical protein
MIEWDGPGASGCFAKQVCGITNRNFDLECEHIGWRHSGVYERNSRLAIRALAALLYFVNSLMSSLRHVL